MGVEPKDKQRPEDCRPGSIRQKLDMCENGELRGDEILHGHGREPARESGAPEALDQAIDRHWDMDLSEAGREGDEMSGDEHSSGLAGGEAEIEGQPHLTTGTPGEETRREAAED